MPGSRLDAILAAIRRVPTSTWDRLLAFFLLLPSAAVLGLAAHLPPDPSGFGTHRALGLGPCTLLAITGWPCPTCGMTTTFSLAMHGHPILAFLNQPFGFLLFTVTLATALMSLAELFHPTGLLRRAWRFLEAREGWAAGLLVGGMLLGWLYKVARFRGIF